MKNTRLEHMLKHNNIINRYPRGEETNTLATLDYLSRIASFHKVKLENDCELDRCHLNLNIVYFFNGEIDCRNQLFDGINTIDINCYIPYDAFRNRYTKPLLEKLKLNNTEGCSFYATTVSDLLFLKDRISLARNFKYDESTPINISAGIMYMERKNNKLNKFLDGYEKEAFIVHEVSGEKLKGYDSNLSREDAIRKRIKEEDENRLIAEKEAPKLEEYINEYIEFCESTDKITVSYEANELFHTNGCDYRILKIAGLLACFELRKKITEQDFISAKDMLDRLDNKQ